MTVESNSIVFLGFSGSVLSMIINSLKAAGFKGTCDIIENVETEDSVSFDNGMNCLRKWHSEHAFTSTDKLFFSLANSAVKIKTWQFFRDEYQLDQSQFIDIIHPFSSVSETTRSNKGVYLGPGVITDAYTELGFAVFINRGATVGHHTTVGEFCTINPGVHIAGHCNIGAGSTIGLGAIVFDHVNIGAGSIIGGGSVVTKDIPPGVLAYGNPCKVVRKL